MFTGIIAALGQVKALQPQQGDVRLQIDAGKLECNDIQLGDSVAINGVCLTVVEQQASQLFFDVSQETLKRSSLGQLKPGSLVNLEKALAVGDRLGGHFVSGHVDGLGTVSQIKLVGQSWRMKVAVAEALQKYIAEKGSICIDGVSLTVNAVDSSGFEVNIIPHTLQETIIQHYQTDSQVNLEVDLIARYLERLLPRQQAGVTMETLVKNGFIK